MRVYNILGHGDGVGSVNKGNVCERCKSVLIVFLTQLWPGEGYIEMLSGTRGEGHATLSERISSLHPVALVFT